MTDPEETKPPKSLLMAMLWNKMKDNGDSTQALTHILGCSYPYLMALLRGERPAAGMARPIMLAVAKYLGVPPVHVYIHSGAMETNDFFVTEDLPGKISRLHDVMRCDPLWATYLPARKDWDQLSEQAWVLIGLLYERTGSSLLFSEIDQEKQKG